MNEEKTLDLVFLWHMHQPDYRDRLGNEFRLPWTYLHAIKDYTDMAAHFERHPRVRAVVNFVPVLVDQLEDYAGQFARREFRDPLLRLLAHPDMEQLTVAERKLLLGSCFRSNHLTMLAPFPRYQRLYDLYKRLEEQGDAAQGYLSGAYFSDLVTWYHLAWTGETERRNRPQLAELMSKGEAFDHDDRLLLISIMGDMIAGLVPRYRALAARGQIELSATPYAHPLAPLLLDFASARDSEPNIALPRAAAYPGGRARVAAHIERAITSHTQRFGAPPGGFWPAEGAVSEGLLQLLGAAGGRWAASSEAVLANSLRLTSRDLPPRKSYLYRPYRCTNAPSVTMFFRDERLSDLIGFEYAKWHGKDAAAHFVAELEAIRDQAPPGETPLVCIFLDGENAWEYYPYNGYYFFEDLYCLLEAHPRIRTTTLSAYVDHGKQSTEPLPRLCAGSWVYGTFSTWIGDPEKNRAWELLCAAKQSYDLVMASGRLDDAAAAAAAAQLAVCESSDWFWWFGDYNPAEAVTNFDELFRLNLERLYQLLKLPPPAQLAEPISRGKGRPESGGTMRRAS